MIWFNPDGAESKELRRPVWGNTTQKLPDHELVQRVIIGQGIVEPGPANPQFDTPAKPPEPGPPAPEVEPEVEQAGPEPTPPEPVEDPRVQIQLKLLASSISEFSRMQQAAQKRDLDFCLDLAFAVAEELTCQELSIDRTKVFSIVKEAVGMLDDDEPKTVRLHPELISAFEEKELIDELEQIPHISIKSDSNCGKLGCAVETPNRVVDGDVLTRLEQLRNLFNEMKGNKQ